MKILKEVYRELEEYFIGDYEEERGVFLAKNQAGTICDFVPDEHGSRDSFSFYPSADVLLEASNRWKEEDLELSGIVHSHPNGKNGKLSSGDLLFGKKFFDLNPHINELYLSVFFDNELFVYRLYRTKSGITTVPEDLLYLDYEYPEEPSITKPDLKEYYEDGEAEMNFGMEGEIDGQLRL